MIRRALATLAAVALLPVLLALVLPAFAQASAHPTVRPPEAQKAEHGKATMKLSKKHHAVAGHAPGVKVGQCVPHQCQPPKLAKNAPAAQNCHGKGNSFTCCWDFNGGAVATGWFNQTIASYTLEDFFCASRFKIVSNDVSIHPHVNFFPNVIGWSWDKELQRDPRWYWAHKSGPHTGFYVASQGKFDYCPAHVGGLCFHWYPEVKMWVWAGGKAGTVAPGGKYMVSE